MRPAIPPPRRLTPVTLPAVPRSPRVPRDEAPTGPPPSLAETLAAHPPESYWRTAAAILALAKWAGWR